MTKRVGDLELDQDLIYQNREWRVERIGWIILALLVLAALLGILGKGPLSKAIAGSQDGPLWVEYQRFVRHRSPTELIVRIEADAAQEGRIHLQLNQEFVQKAQIQRIDPEPDQEQVAMDRITYVFQVGEGAAPVQVIYRLEMQSFGLLSTPIGIVDGPEVSINQFVYP
jgi:hypothetical protein